MATSSAEDYLRVVYNLHKLNGEVRSVDVANTLDVTKASVHKAMSLLEEDGYVEHDKYGPVRLTKAGLAAGKKLEDRYSTIYGLLTEVFGVEAEVAAEEAHEIEHAVSPDTLKKIKAFLDAR